MDPLLLTALVVIGVPLLAQWLAGGDRALKARRWTAWLLVPLGIALVLEARAPGVGSFELWSQRLALATAADWWISSMRRAWRERHRGAPVA